MKRIKLFTAVAALALVSPLAISSAAAQPEQLFQLAQYERPSQEAQRRDDRTRDDGRRDREGWRDDDRSARWDDSRHNGYYQSGRWTYGRPPAGSYGRVDFQLGYQPWTVGQSLGRYYGNRFDRVDYRRAQLHRPGQGQHWVRDGRGDYLLINRSYRVVQVVETRDRRSSWRDTRHDARWDDRQHNGYYVNGQWTFGPPPEGRYRRNDVVYGYQPWQRGQRLGYYQGRYSEVDYRTDRRLDRPPRGYHWVRSDSGDFLLAAIATGIIAQVILASTR